MIDRSALEAAVAGAEPPELLALAGELQGRAWAHLAPAPVARQDAGKWLTPAEAAGLARASKRQVYEWAVGKRWAHRPTRRKLLIDEAGFQAWLGSRP